MRIVRVLSAVLAIAFALVLGVGTTFAQGGTGGAAGQTTSTGTEAFTLAPGGTATITFEAFCTDFGLEFPDSIELPNALADQDVRNALGYIQSEGLAGSEQDALEAQYGLWQVTGANGSPQGTQIAADVVTAAGTAVQDPTGTSLLDAAQAGDVTITLSNWQPVGQPVPIGAATDNFFGRGTLTVENVSGEELTLYHPVGALFPPSVAGEQTMAGYATEVQVNNPAQAQATAAPTTAATTAPTTAATTAPTTAAATSATAAPTAQSSAAQPNQLPNTAEGDSAPVVPFALAIGALVAGGLLLRRMSGRAR